MSNSQNLMPAMSFGGAIKRAFASMQHLVVEHQEPNFGGLHCCMECCY